jgi:short-subunit dehydrogenase
MTKTFLPHLLKRSEGIIVNVSSMGGFLPVPGQTIYGSSKAAVKLFTEGLNSELTGTNVHVMGVFPGAIGTNIAANSGVWTLGQRSLQGAERDENVHAPVCGGGNYQRN